MKRGCPDHPKTKALGARLKLTRWQVVGLLETLWHFTAQYSKRGDIGKWTNEEIAAALEWAQSPSDLVDALVDTKWLDKSDSFRLLVHDWKDHADQTVARSDEVKKLGFASEMLANASTQLANASQPMSCLASPSLALPSLALPSPTPSANGKTLAEVGDGDGGDFWGEVKKKADDLFKRFKGVKPKENLRRKIAASLWMVESGQMPGRWVSEAVAQTLRNAKDDCWAYLWKCLRTDANDMGKDLCRIVAQIDLPKGF